MTLLEGISNKGHPFRIPDCSRDELPQFFKALGFVVGAEIGVYKGEFTEKFCQAGLKMFAIDPWHSYNGAARDQARQNFLYEHTHRVLEKYLDCTIIRKASMDAVCGFKDRSLDFVYIDANHNFKHVAQDIYEWTWKVRKGGIVAGHDYTTNSSGAQRIIRQVRPAVDAYLQAFSIEDFYVIGEGKDKCSSWMFIRK